MTKPKAAYHPSDLAKFLEYAPETGFLTWRPRHLGMTFAGRTIDKRFIKHFNRTCAGKRAEHQSGQGYLNVSLFHKSLRAHRVAWAIHHDSWPTNQLDHINGIRDDNRLLNLRVVTPSLNSQNMKLYKSNVSGVHGVYFVKKSSRWAAYIRHLNKPTHLGTFDRFEDAVAARRAAEMLYGFHPNHGRG